MNQVVLAAIAVVLTLLAFASIPDRADYYNSRRRVCDTRTQVESLQDKGEWQKAADVCTRALQSSDRKDLYRVSILLDLARMQAEANLPEKAIANAEEAIKVLKSLPICDKHAYVNEFLRAHALAAHLYRTQNKPKQATRILDDAQELVSSRYREPGGNLFNCQLMFENAMAIASSQPQQSRQLLGQCVVLANKLPSAPKLYLHIAQTYAQSLPPDHPYLIEMLEYCRADTVSSWGVIYHKGIRQLAGEQFDEAIRLFTQALQELPQRSPTDPRDVLCRRGLAECLFRLGNYQSALSLIDDERRLNIDYPLSTERAFLLHRSAQCQRELGHPKQALALLFEERKIIEPLLSKSTLFRTKMWEMMVDISEATDIPCHFQLLREHYDYITSSKGTLSKRQIEKICSLGVRLCSHYNEINDAESVEAIAKRTIDCVGFQYSSRSIRHDLGIIYNVRGHNRAARKLGKTAADDLCQYIDLCAGIESRKTMAAVANSAASLYLESKNLVEGIRLLKVADRYYDDPVLKNQMQSLVKQFEAQLRE